MNGTWLTIINAVMAVFSIVGIGFALRRLGWLSEEADQTMLKLVIRVLLPCLIFDKIIGNAQMREPANLIGPPIAAFAMVAIASVAALLAARLGKNVLGFHNNVERRTFAFSVGLHNYGYIPLPLVELLYPNDSGTLGVLLVYMMGVELTVWTLGVALLPGGRGQPLHRRIINAPAIAIVVAVVLNFMGAESWLFGQAAGDAADGAKEEWFIARVVALLGQCAVPLGILLVGATVADFFGQTRFRACWRPVVAACVLRLGLLPGAFILAAAFTPGISEELRRVLVIEAAMPAAVYPIILTRLFGGDPPTAVRIAISTSLAGLLTIPAWIALGIWMIGAG